MLWIKETMDILLKYKPKHINDFLGNNALKLKLNELLKASSNYTIMFMGVSGCGKSTLSNLFLNMQDKQILRVGSEDIHDNSNLKSLITNFLTNKNIESFLSKKDKVVFFDDIDISMTLDKSIGGLVGEIISKCKERKDLSLILTSCVSEEKRITELKKQLDVQRIYNPSVKDTYVYISNILDKEQKEYDGDALLRLAKTYDGNIRHVVLNLHNMSDPEKEKNNMEFFDKTSFEIIKKLFSQKLSIKSLCHTSDNSLVPFLLYENFPQHLLKRKMDKNNAVDALINVTDGFVTSEKFEKHMYQSTDWSNYDLVTVLRTFPINNVLNSYPEKGAKGVTENYTFTQLLSKTAQKQIYYKKLLSTQESLKIYDLDTLIVFYDSIGVNIIKNQDKVKEFCKYLSQYISKEELSVILSYLTHLEILDKKLSAKLKRYM
jgi:ABC-type dipeptide/oligopeptide/nickel transport system ATPase component